MLTFGLFTIFTLIVKQSVMGDLAPTDIARAVTLIENGRSYSDVAEMFGKAKSTIHRNVTRWRQTGEYVRRRGRQKTFNHGCR